jgi:hypothetical protein
LLLLGVKEGATLRLKWLIQREAFAFYGKFLNNFFLKLTSAYLTGNGGLNPQTPHRILIESFDNAILLEPFELWAFFLFCIVLSREKTRQLHGILFSDAKFFYVFLAYYRLWSSPQNALFGNRSVDVASFDKPQQINQLKA